MSLGLNDYLNITIDQAQQMSDSRLQGVAADLNMHITSTSKESTPDQIDILLQIWTMLDQEIKRRNLNEE